VNAKKEKVNAKFFFGVDFLEPPMAFCRQIESMHLKAKGLLKPLKTRLFSANNFFVENKRVLKVFSCFEAPSALTNFLNYCCPLKVEKRKISRTPHGAGFVR
jgi:hypothetical protein